MGGAKRFAMVVFTVVAVMGVIQLFLSDDTTGRVIAALQVLFAIAAVLAVLFERPRDRKEPPDR